MRPSAALVGAALAAALWHSPGIAQTGPVTSGVLGQLIGDWTITGVTRGQMTQTGAQVRSEFGGAFLEMHIFDPDKRSQYEARVFIGEDARGALVAHWLDGTGGETSRTLGVGAVKGNHVTLTFPYPGNEFRDRLDYDRAKDRWRLVIEMGPRDHAQLFSDWTFDRVRPQ